MAIDSTAELLFNITANADDAAENIAKFRTLMGKDLSDLGGEFQTWSDEVLGEITTVQAAMTAGFAVMAAGLVAVAAGIHESIGEYEKYVDQVSHAMRVTGMSAESLSNLHSVAAKAEVDYDTMVTGLVRLEQSAVKAAQGSKQQMDAFKALGITDKEVIAGQKDMVPLLEKVMDGFHGNASAAQRAALARDLMSRSGAELLPILSKGSEYLKENSKEAEALGLIIHDSDITAFREFKLEMKGLDEVMEGVAARIGKDLMPYMAKAAAMATATYAALKQFAAGGIKGFTAPLTFMKEYADTLGKIHQQIAEELKTGGDAPPLLNTAKIKEAKTEFDGITSIVDTLGSKLATLGGDKWQELWVEVGHYRDELTKSTAELLKMEKAGTITAESAQRETAKLSMIPGMISQVVQQTSANIRSEETKAWGEAVLRSIEAEDAETEAMEKAGEARVQVTREIQGKLATQDQVGFARERAGWMAQQNAWIADLAKKTNLTLADWAAMSQITMEGLLKIDKTESDAWQIELAKMREHLESMVVLNSTEAEKIAAEKQKAIEQEMAAEDEALKKVEGDEAKANQIRQMYAQIRTQLDVKYANELHQLVNSQGWQGVFGNHFAQELKQNQQLAQQWAISTNQSLLMVKVTLESLKEESEQTFQNFIQGMAQSMTQAFITGKSIGQAMKQVLESTLESIAGQAAVQAIYATALGFLDLAEQNYPGAEAAFTSAAIFASVAAAAAVTGKAIGAAGASGSGSGSGGSSGASKSSYGAPQPGAVAGSGSQQQQGNVYVTVQGHVIGPSGAAQLADILNQAVYGNDVTLYASHSKSGVPLG